MFNHYLKGSAGEDRDESALSTGITEDVSETKSDSLVGTLSNAISPFLKESMNVLSESLEVCCNCLGSLFCCLCKAIVAE